MKKKILVITALVLMVLGCALIPQDTSAKLVCHPDPVNPGEEECVPEGYTGEEKEDDTPSEGYDACNNVLPGGSTPPGFCEEKGHDDLIEVVKNVLNAVYFWVGILAVIFIIVGGVNYTISQGDPGKVSKAKSTILYAVIGLIVSLLAFAITEFVLNALGGNV